MFVLFDSVITQTCLTKHEMWLVFCRVLECYFPNLYGVFIVLEESPDNSGIPQSEMPYGFDKYFSSLL